VGVGGEGVGVARRGLANCRVAHTSVGGLSPAAPNSPPTCPHLPLRAPPTAPTGPQFLLDDFQIGPDHVEALYQYAKFQFDCGNYSMAAELLQPYRTLCTSTERNMSALWGKLGSDILMQNFEAAREDIIKLRDAIDNQTFALPLVQLQQRTFLLHWSLFVYWNHENGRNDLIDLFFSPPYLAAIQINAQHLLRYLAVAVVINKRRRSVMKDMIKTIQQEAYEYSDPITQFIEDLFVNYDFDGAQQKLKACEVVIDNDFFLTACKDEFVENARLFIFEVRGAWAWLGG
jgi:translation initiation factor 3 subunit E